MTSRPIRTASRTGLAIAAMAAIVMATVAAVPRPTAGDNPLTRASKGHAGAMPATRSTTATTNVALPSTFSDANHLVHSINIGEYGCGDPFNSNAQLQLIVSSHNIPYIRAPFRDGCTDAQYLDMLHAIVHVGAVPQVIIHGNCTLDSTLQATGNHWLSLVDGVTTGDYWVEYGNEEDIGCGGSPITHQQYVAGWNRDIPVFHASHPRARFMGPVTAGHSTTWINDLLANGVPHPDAISWHWYPCGLSTDTTTCLTNTSHIDNDIAQTDAEESLVGVPAPIWITEWDMGFNQDQTTWLKQCFIDPTCVQPWLAVAITHMIALNRTSNLAATEFYVLTNGNPNSQTQLCYPPPSVAFTPVGAAFFAAVPSRFTTQSAPSTPSSRQPVVQVSPAPSPAPR